MFDQQPTSSSAAGQFPSISFLSRYRDFLALYTLSSSSTSTNSLTNQDSLEEKKYRLKRQAAELLVLLLTSGIAPKRFWAVMLLDAVGLLESEFFFLVLPLSLRTGSLDVSSGLFHEIRS